MTVKLKRVIIIGAGIGGLCAAVGLRRLGLDVEVYEQTPAFGAVGAGLTLWANAIKGLRQLGLTEDALGGARVGRSELVDWRGRVLSSMAVDKLEPDLGAPSLAVHRADLHRVLLSALPEGMMHTGAVCTGFEQKDHGQIAACFADGSAAQGDFLIGADGIHSVIRRLMFPQVRLRYSGYIAWRGVVDFAGSSAPDRTSETWGRGARFGIVPIGQGRVYWFATANMPEDHRAAPGRHKPDLLQRFRGWHAPIEALIQATPDDAILYNQISDFPPLAHWSQRQVTILGDAAHPTTPNLGQGACQAIESSVVLTRCLAEEQDLSTALQRYERERMPRTAWITNTSWQVGSVAQLEHPALIAIRDFVMRSMPASITRAQIMKAAGYNV